MTALFATTGSSGAAVGTATIASDVLTIAGHGLVDGQVVVTSAPTGAAVGVLVPDAPYYVAAATTDTFQLRPAPGAPVMTVASGGAVVDAAEAVYDPQGLRQALGGLLYKARVSPPDVGRFGARAGVLQNSASAEVSVSGMVVTVGDLNCVVSTTGSTTRGPYLCAIGSTAHTLAAADATYTRIDVLVAEVLDDTADGSGDLVPGRTRVITGTPASVPVAPTVADGLLELAQLTVAAGATTATLSYTARFTVAAGGILPVSASAALPTTNRREGMYADQADADALVRYSGSAWETVASVRAWSYWNTTASGASVTGPTSFTPTLTGGGSATFSTASGFYQRIAPKVVLWGAQFTVATAGSGTTSISITGPSSLLRTIRQVTTGSMEATGLTSNLEAVSFTSGTGATWDRVRAYLDSDTEADNMQGQHLVASATLAFTGVYFEA